MSYEPGHKSVFSEHGCYYGVTSGLVEESVNYLIRPSIHWVLNSCLTRCPPPPRSITDLRREWDSPPT